MRTAEEVTRELERTVPVLKKHAVTVMHKAVDLTARLVGEQAPKGKTGRLARNLSHTVRETQTGVSGTVRPRELYAEDVERGTGIYVEFHARVAPLAARRVANPRAALKIPGIGFRRSVAGQRPNPFMQRVRTESAAEVQGILESGAETATRELFP